MAGYLPAWSARPTRSSSSATRFWRCALDTRAISSGKATLAATVREVSRLKCWKTRPILRRSKTSLASGRTAISSPSSRILPDWGRSKPLKQRNRVDLPAPERPIIPNLSPLPTLNEISCKATCPPKERLSRSTSSSFMATKVTQHRGTLYPTPAAHWVAGKLPPTWTPKGLIYRPRSRL